MTTGQQDGKRKWKNTHVKYVTGNMHGLTTAEKYAYHAKTT